MVKLVSGRAAVPQEHQGVSMRPLRWLELPAPVCKSALSGRDLGLYGGLAAVRVVESLCPTLFIKIKISLEKTAISHDKPRVYSKTHKKVFRLQL